MKRDGRERPRLLLLAPDLPFPVRAGGQMRMASFVPALARVGTLHIACTARDLPAETEAWCAGLGCTIEGVAPAPERGLSFWRGRLSRLAGGTNLRRHPEEAGAFQDVYRRIAPDLVWLETPYLLRYALPWRGQVPLVVDYWGTSQGAERLRHHLRGPARLRAELGWRAARAGEHRYAPRVPDIVCVSEEDAVYFRDIAPHSRVWSIPNGISRERRLHLGSLTVDEQPDTMILTGDLSYRPNIDAAIWFVEEILPLVRSGRPAARVRIVGRDPRPEVRALAGRPGVEVTGWVPDLGAEVASAALYVLPMRLGSGIRSKLFEVFPLGKAIVTTSTGAEGLALVDGENVLIRDDTDGFAQACVRLLGDPGLRAGLGERVGRLAREVYAQERIETALAEVVATAWRERTDPSRSG